MLLARRPDGVHLLGEDVADQPGGQLHLAVEERRRAHPLSLLLDLGSRASGEIADVGLELLLSSPLPTVRTMIPSPWAGSSWHELPQAAPRSARSSIFRETPMCSSPGMSTRKRPGSEIWVVTRGPFVPIGSFVTWTRTSWPFFSASSILGTGPSRRGRPPPRRVSSSSSSRRGRGRIPSGQIQERAETRLLEAQVHEGGLHPRGARRSHVLCRCPPRGGAASGRSTITSTSCLSSEQRNAGCWDFQDRDDLAAFDSMVGSGPSAVGSSARTGRQNADSSSASRGVREPALRSTRPPARPRAGADRNSNQRNRLFLNRRSGRR